jgi:hypothetical protein
VHGQALPGRPQGTGPAVALGNLEMMVGVLPTRARTAQKVLDLVTLTLARGVP